MTYDCNTPQLGRLGGWPDEKRATPAAGSYPEKPDRESIKRLELAGEEGWEVVSVVEIRAGYLLLLAKRPQQ